jgi:DNA helicase IV
LASRSAQIAAEQQQLDRFYARLDELRDRTSQELADVERQGAHGTPQARSERDALATFYAARLRALTAAEYGLCFGRIDLTSGERHYIGRVGLSDDEHHSMLVDWRAPAAQAFYQATPASPEGLTRRRHLRLRRREVIGVDDDLLDADDLDEMDRETLSGEAALLASLTAKRTGHMGDIVATIQGEQDRIIRSDARGMLVVQGGPGTGKTAVALHRAAYLLYTHRERLERAGVLVVAPNSVFLRYIDQVLPSLGETGVVLATPEQMVPGVTVTGRESDDVARLKGDARMAQVIAQAALQRKRVPKTPVLIPYESEELQLTRRAATAARRRALGTRRRHNAARGIFIRGILDSLMSQAQDAATDTDPAEVRWLQRELLSIDELREAIDDMWPRLSATQLVEELFASPEALDAAAGELLTAQERAMLQRRAGSPWTAADVPLLDEAFSLLGDPMEQVRRAAERRRLAEERRYAQEVLALTGTSAMVDADTLAARFRDNPTALTLAERSASDPDATFGHVIIDEAQELSPMMWRLLLRRCPSRSMTIVGDVAQSSSAAATTSWAEVLDDVAPDRWRLAELTVNYRTPSEIMAVAGDVLTVARPGMEPPRSVRDAGFSPRAVAVQDSSLDALVAGVATTAREELAAVGEGTIAVIVPEQHRQALAAALSSALPEMRTDGRPDALDSSLVMLDVREIKGLEFDGVVVVDPQAILDNSGRGAGDLYVAVTRATTRLAVVHHGPLPDMLHRLKN